MSFFGDRPPWKTPNVAALEAGGPAMDDTRHGSCLCGAVRFRTNGPLRGVIYCHCTQCRKQTGHYLAATSVADDRIAVEGGENLTWYRASDSARRGFCATCGSALFWKHDGLDTISVMAGAFDGDSGLSGQSHIFVGAKGDYYTIDDGLPRFERSSPGVIVAD
jgi:hypothetical protein